MREICDPDHPKFGRCCGGVVGLSPMDPEVTRKYLRNLPSVEEFLHHPRIQAQLHRHSRERVVDSIREVLGRQRENILGSTDPQAAAAVATEPEALADYVEENLSAAARPSLRPVINATGVVLHTNLGRAPLCQEALQQIMEVAAGYSNLEFDLAAGRRGSRYSHVEEILCRISGAEAGMVVNNNAGAVLLALNSLAEGQEVIVSRGELVEIGGSFRIPDVMKKSGARLVEVGTTNRTHLEDYERAIGENTALLLKVHRSNFRVLGFTAEVSLQELAALGEDRGLPVMEDLGSGCFVDLAPFGLEREPTVQEALRAGAGAVTFSGDKLLGGPQAGIILGKRRHLDPIRKNPLTRTLRIDKLTLAGLEATLRVYLDMPKAMGSIPVLSMLTRPAAELERRSRRLQRRLSGELGTSCRVRLREESSQVGGGALPLQDLPSKVVALRPLGISTAQLEETLRRGDPPVIARIHEDELLFDLRTVAESEEAELMGALKKAMGKNRS